MGYYLNTDNISLDIKYIFLHFAQNYFGNPRSRYSWSSDVRTTDIIIADKFAIDLGVATQRPSVILSRGGMGWTYTVRGQKGILNPPAEASSVWNFGQLNAVPNDIDALKGQQYTDLLRASIVYNIISKQGVEADDIANKLFVALTGHKADLRSAGVFKMLSMSISEESLLRYKGDVELYGVSLGLSFLTQPQLFESSRDHNLRVWVDGDEVYENTHFRVLPSGTQIKFFDEQESTAVVTATFVDAVTLQLRSLVTLTSSDYITYTVPNGWGIYGYYKIVTTIITDMYPYYDDRDDTTTDYYTDPVWSGVTYAIDEGLANGSAVGNPVVESGTYWARVLAGTFSDDTGQDRDYVYTITSGNTLDAFAINSTTGALTVNDSTALDYDTTPSFTLTLHCEPDTGDEAVEDLTVIVNLNDV